MALEGGAPAPASSLIGGAQVARILNCSRRTVSRLVSSGALRPVVVAPGGRSGVPLFDPAQVGRLAARQPVRAYRRRAQ